MATRRPRLQIRPNIARINRDTGSSTAKKNVSGSSESAANKDKTNEETVIDNKPAAEKLDVIKETKNDSEIRPPEIEVKDIKPDLAGREFHLSLTDNSNSDEQISRTSQESSSVPPASCSIQSSTSVLEVTPVYKDHSESPAIFDSPTVSALPVTSVVSPSSTTPVVSPSSTTPAVSSSSSPSSATSAVLQPSITSAVSSSCILSTVSVSELSQSASVTTSVAHTQVVSASSTPRLSALLSAPPAYAANIGKAGKKARPEKEARPRHVKFKEPPERNKMTMLDLIYWNPSENPMKTSKSKEKQSEVQLDAPSSLQTQENSSHEVVNRNDAVDPFAPKLKIGPNGEITIDEESLVIQHTTPENYSVVTEESDTNYFSFRKKEVSRKWSFRDTAIFYKALMMVGTDFALMSNLISDRSRHELKLKFKKEERQNRAMIDRILSSPNAFDVEQFELELDELRNLIPADDPVKKKRSSRTRSTKPRAPEDYTQDEIVERNKNRRRGASRRNVVVESDLSESEVVDDLQLEPCDSIEPDSEQTPLSKKEKPLKPGGAEVKKNRGRKLNSSNPNAEDISDVIDNTEDTEIQENSEKQKSINSENELECATRKQKRKAKKVNSVGNGVTDKSNEENTKAKAKKSSRSIPDSTEEQAFSIATERPRRVIKKPKRLDSDGDYSFPSSGDEFCDSNSSHGLETTKMSEGSARKETVSSSMDDSENLNRNKRNRNRKSSGASSSSSSTLKSNDTSTLHDGTTSVINNGSKSDQEINDSGHELSGADNIVESGEVIVMPMETSTVEINEVGSFVTVEAVKARKKKPEFVPLVVDGVPKVRFNQAVAMAEKSEVSEDSSRKKQPSSFSVTPSGEHEFSGDMNDAENSNHQEKSTVSLDAEQSYVRQTTVEAEGECNAHQELDNDKSVPTQGIGSNPSIDISLCNMDGEEAVQDAAVTGASLYSTEHSNEVTVHDTFAGRLTTELVEINAKEAANKCSPAFEKVSASDGMKERYLRRRKIKPSVHSKVTVAKSNNKTSKNEWSELVSNEDKNENKSIPGEKNRENKSLPDTIVMKPSPSENTGGSCVTVHDGIGDEFRNLTSSITSNTQAETNRHDCESENFHPVDENNQSNENVVFAECKDSVESNALAPPLAGVDYSQNPPGSDKSVVVPSNDTPASGKPAAQAFNKQRFLKKFRAKPSIASNQRLKNISVDTSNGKVSSGNDKSALKNDAIIVDTCKTSESSLLKIENQSQNASNATHVERTQVSGLEEKNVVFASSKQGSFPDSDLIISKSGAASHDSSFSSSQSFKNSTPSEVKIYDNKRRISADDNESSGSAHTEISGSFDRDEKSSKNFEQTVCDSKSVNPCHSGESNACAICHDQTLVSNSSTEASCKNSEAARLNTDGTENSPVGYGLKQVTAKAPSADLKNKLKRKLKPVPSLVNAGKRQKSSSNEKFEKNSGSVLLASVNQSCGSDMKTVKNVSSVDEFPTFGQQKYCNTLSLYRVASDIVSTLSVEAQKNHIVKDDSCFNEGTKQPKLNLGLETDNDNMNCEASLNKEAIPEGSMLTKEKGNEHSSRSNVTTSLPEASVFVSDSSFCSTSSEGKEKNQADNPFAADPSNTPSTVISADPFSSSIVSDINLLKSSDVSSTIFPTSRQGCSVLVDSNEPQSFSLDISPREKAKEQSGRLLEPESKKNNLSERRDIIEWENTKYRRLFPKGSNKRPEKFQKGILSPFTKSMRMSSNLSEKCKNGSPLIGENEALSGSLFSSSSSNELEGISTISSSGEPTLLQSTHHMQKTSPPEQNNEKTNSSVVIENSFKLSSSPHGRDQVQECPSSNVNSSSIMLLKQSQGEDNTFHLFMRNNPQFTDQSQTVNATNTLGTSSSTVEVHQQTNEQNFAYAEQISGDPDKNTPVS